MLGFAIFAAIALRFLLPRLQKAPPNATVGMAVLARGVKPTGPEGTWTRSDHLRAAGFSGTVALLLCAVAWVGGTVVEKAVNGSTLNMIGSGLLFLGAIGIAMACLSALVSLIKAVLTSSRGV